MGRDELIVRTAQAGDFDAWSRMRHLLWPDASAAQHRAEVQALAEAADWKAWIAADSERYLGFAEASIRPFANGCDSRPVAFLEGIWVKEPARRHGIGRRLMQAVETWAKSRGIYELGSDAELKNTLSHLSHQGWGFEETERVVYFRKKLAP